MRVMFKEWVSFLEDDGKLEVGRNIGYFLN